MVPFNRKPDHGDSDLVSEGVRRHAARAERKEVLIRCYPPPDHGELQNLINIISRRLAAYLEREAPLQPGKGRAGVAPDTP